MLRHTVLSGRQRCLEKGVWLMLNDNLVVKIQRFCKGLCFGLERYEEDASSCQEINKLYVDEEVPGELGW